MRHHLRKPWVWVVAILLAAAWMLWPRPVSSPAPATPATIPAQPAPAGSAPRPAAARADPAATPPAARPAATLPAFLPPEAGPTIDRILAGGPHPYRQDGGTFGNREGRLPHRPRGWYREYTVDTPGLDHRGARRIVTGGKPPRDWYYTDDHYDSFRAFDVPEQASRQ